MRRSWNGKEIIVILSVYFFCRKFFVESLYCVPRICFPYRGYSASHTSRNIAYKGKSRAFPTMDAIY